MSTPTIEVFTKIFGNFEPSEAEDKGEDSEKLAADLQKEKEIKESLFQKSEKQIHLEYYQHAGLLFLPADKPRSGFVSAFSDSLVITVNDSGTVKSKSENLAMNFDVDFTEKRLEIIKRNAILAYDITKHNCVNPDCPSCSTNDADVKSPYLLSIGINGGHSYLFFHDFPSAYNVMMEIDAWVVSGYIL